MQEHQKEIKPGNNRGSLPVEVVEILCQTTVGNTLSEAMSAIADPFSSERRRRIMTLLLKLSESEHGASVPVPGSKLVRNILWATVVSFDDPEDKIRFYRDIANTARDVAEFVPELQFTAASMAFNTPMQDEKWSPLYAEVFANLFIKSASVTTAGIATYWQFSHWKEVCKFFGEKCDNVAWCRPQLEMIVAVMDQVQKRIPARPSETSPDAFASFFTLEEAEHALAMIINNLAHKRIAGMSSYSMLSFICEGIRTPQETPSVETKE